MGCEPADSIDPAAPRANGECEPPIGAREDCAGSTRLAHSTLGSRTTEPSSHGTYGRSNSPPGPSRRIALRCGPNRVEERGCPSSAASDVGAPRRERSHCTKAERDVTILPVWSDGCPAFGSTSGAAMAGGAVVVLSLACFACVIELVSAQRSAVRGVQLRPSRRSEPTRLCAGSTQRFARRSAAGCALILPHVHCGST